MKKIFYFFITFFYLHIQPLIAQQKDASSTQIFIENKNQWEKPVLFRAEIPGGFLFLKNQAFQYSFYDTQAIWNMHASIENKESGNFKEMDDQDKGQIKAHSYTASLLGSNPEAMLESIDPSETVYNYFIGTSEHWASGAKAYSVIHYKEIYPNTDLHFYKKDNTLKYEFVLKQGADPKKIKMQYSGMDSIYLKEEGLYIKTSLALVQEKQPYTYQMIQGQKIMVPSFFHLEGDIVYFDFPQGYHPDYDLVIDPDIVFSTYSGSFADNWGATATFDNADNLFSGGIVFGNNFPTTSGAFQVSFHGQIDVGILKYNSTGSSLIYATYLGGSETEFPHSLVCNSLNELIIMGTTSSLDFPTTSTAFDRSFNNSPMSLVSVLGGVDYNNGSDIFVAHLNTSGTQLLGSSYFGGSGNDGVNTSTAVTIKNYGDQFRGDVLTDANNDIYLVSITESVNFPVKNAHKSFLSGNQDAVLMKLKPDLSDIYWSTYFGGSNFDAGFSLKLNSANEVYIAGATRSSNLPVQPGALSSTWHGDDDGYVARFTNNGNFIQVTYIGTTGADQAFFIDLNSNDEVHVFGQTLGNYPVFNALYSNANSRQFLHKIDKTLSISYFSTVIGSGRNTPDISPTAFLVNDCGHIYITGWGGALNDNGFVKGSNTKNLPITTDAYKASTTGSDFYIMIIEKDAKSLLYGTFFGSDGGRGNHVDGGTCRFSKKGVIYHSACACSATGNTGTKDFPTTVLAWSRTNNSNNCNNAAFKFDVDGLKPDFAIYKAGTTQNVTLGCAPFNASFQYTGTKANSITWEILGIATFPNQSSFNYTFSQTGTYTIKVTISNLINCNTQASITKTLNISAIDMTVPALVSFCTGQSAQVTVTSPTAISYSWTPTMGVSNPNIPNPILSAKESTTYKVKATDAAGCNIEKNVELKVLDINIDFNLEYFGKCGEPQGVNFINNTTDATYFEWDMGNGVKLNGQNPDGYIYPKPGQYKVTLKAGNDYCTTSKEKIIQIEDNTIPAPNVITPNKDGKNDYLIFENRENYNLVIYNRWGNVVYHSPAYQQDWDGKGVESGTYYYLLKSPAGVECKGWVEIIK